MKLRVFGAVVLVFLTLQSCSDEEVILPEVLEPSDIAFNQITVSNPTTQLVSDWTNLWLEPPLEHSHIYILQAMRRQYLVWMVIYQMLVT
jgi:hypothetical protein